MMTAMLALAIASGPGSVPLRQHPDELVVGQRFADGRGVVAVSSETGGQSWFLLPTSLGAEEALPRVHAALALVEEVLASPDGRWLAVVSSAAGHPALEVVDLRSLLAGRGWFAVASVNPYPARLRLFGWHGDDLVLLSDGELARCGEGCGGRRADFRESPEAAFLLRPETGVLRVAGADSGVPGPDEIDVE